MTCDMYMDMHMSMYISGYTHQELRRRVIEEGRKRSVRNRRLQNGMSIAEAMIISSATWPERVSVGGVTSPDEYTGASRTNFSGSGEVWY